MATRHRTVARQETTFALGDEPILVDLPVNPLSFIDITMRMLVNGVNTLPTVAQILTALTNVEVLFKGSSIISIDPDDLFVLQHALGWLWPVPQPIQTTDNAPIRITLRVSFSRRPFWVNEGFPASRRGELQLRMTPAAAGAVTVVDGFSLNVETEEILDAQFRQFLKYTTISKTPSATGDHDTDLPIGNPLHGVLLFGTTVPTGTAITASIRELRFLVDNQEVFIPRTRWDTLHAQLMGMVPGAQWIMEHTHEENTAAMYAQNATTRGPEWDVHPLNRWAYLDFDPLKDSAYAVQTAGRSRVMLRINADVADAIRVIPVEMIELTGAPAPTV